jgi:hypothetical protein
LDKEFVRSLERTSATLWASAEEIKKELGNNRSIDDKTKSILSFLAHVTLNGIAALYELEAINTNKLYGFAKRSESRDVKISQNDYDFIKWERRYREDQAKDVEKSNGEKYH